VGLRGNVYIADTGNRAIKKWTAARGISTIVAAKYLSKPNALAVDAHGNVTIADIDAQALKQLGTAYVPGKGLNESGSAGSDMLLPVRPTTTSLTGKLAPTSDQGWLTITSVANGVVKFSFTQNNRGVPRVGNLFVLGQQISVTQAAQSPG
jgi:Putative binding domain, N-terminal